MARYLSIIDVENDIVVDQIPTNLTDEQAINIDEFLRKNNIISDRWEVAITEEI